MDLGKEFAILVFDLRVNSLVVELTDYADGLIQVSQLSKLTVVQEMGHLIVFWAYLNGQGLRLEQVSDKVLRDFKGFCHSAVLQSPAHRGNPHAAEKTVNSKLIRVYRWLHWLKNSGKVPASLMGVTGCSVYSGLVGDPFIYGPLRKNRLNSDAEKYPLLFRIKDRNSKHSLPKTIPDENMLDEIHRYFHEHSESPYLAHRNCLIATFAAYTGFRRGSIQSLQVNQFEGEGCVRPRGHTVILRPLRQKFGYGNIFEIPISLHEQVVYFITKYRSAFISGNRIPTKKHLGSVFISARQGSPLTDRAMSALISKAMRAVGATKGTALHAFRAMYAVDTLHGLYQERVLLRLDTSGVAMEQALATKLGHRDPKSVRPYISSHEASEVARLRAMRDVDQSKDKLLVAELERQVLILKKRLGE